MNAKSILVTALAAVASLPALAAAPSPVPRIEGVNFSGAWEDPVPPEVLRPPGSPPAPRIVPDAPLNDKAREEMAARRAAQQARPATELTGGAACMPVASRA